MRAVEKAYQTVKEGIVSGRYPPSARIREQDIAADAGVSRTPVREALRRLHAEGLIDFRPNLGSVVTTWSQADADEVFALRAMLEAFGARRAALHATPAQLETLRRLAREQHQESLQRREGYIERIGELNSSFHRALQEAASSPRLARALAALIEAPLMMNTFLRYSIEDLQRSAAHHLELVTALEAHDPDWAASVMESHIHAAHRALMRR